MNKKQYSVMALALGLPSTILGVAAIVLTLIDKKIISSGVGLVIILLFIFQMFYLIIRYALQKD